MRTLVWIIAAVALAVWSALAWAVHALVGFAGGVAGRNADIATSDPQTVEWLYEAARLATGLGEYAVIIVWALGAIVILLAPMAASMIARLRGAAR